MTKAIRAGRFGLLLLALGIGKTAMGQAAVTASQAMELSVFGAGTIVHTGLETAKNGAITAGADLTFRPFYFGIRPALEIRGSYPVDQGNLIGEKSGLVGVRFSKTYQRFNPYVDLMYGRGAITYVGGLAIEQSNGTYFEYNRTTTNIYDVGAGVDIRLTHHFDAKADVQLQHWDTPVSEDGKIYSTPVSVGVVYRFDFNHHAKMRKVRPVAEPVGPPPPPATGTSNPPQNF